MEKKNLIVSHYLSCLGQTSCIVGQNLHKELPIVVSFCYGLIAWVILANYGFRTLKFVN